MRFYLMLTAIATMTFFTSQAQKRIRLDDQFVSKPIVRMILNGKKIWVLFDTGSSVNLLDLASKKKYEFNAYRNDDAQNVVAFGSNQYIVRYAANVNLYYRGIKLKDEYLTHDITNIVKSIRAATGYTISAIIGTKTMHKYGVVIDMGNRTASIHYKQRRRDRKRKFVNSAIVANERIP